MAARAVGGAPSKTRIQPSRSPREASCRTTAKGRTQPAYQGGVEADVREIGWLRVHTVSTEWARVTKPASGGAGHAEKCHSPAAAVLGRPRLLHPHPVLPGPGAPPLGSAVHAPELHVGGARTALFMYTRATE